MGASVFLNLHLSDAARHYRVIRSPELHQANPALRPTAAMAVPGRQSDAAAPAQ
jgi:hypothetical protein